MAIKNIFWIYCATLIQLTVPLQAQEDFPEKPMVIISSSRNTKNFSIKNLESTLNQYYSNYRIIWIDDASDDGTPEIVEEYLKKNDQLNKVTFIKNKNRLWAAQNYYTAIHTCKDNEVIVIVDGDDWLAHDKVLQVVNNAYQGNVWLTYGNDEPIIPMSYKCSQKIPTHIIKSNSIRSYKWATGHLRTFYTWLFKKIKLEDFMYEGTFTKAFWDTNSMFPMVEMAGEHTLFIEEILYIYNNTTDYNDSKMEDYHKKRRVHKSRLQTFNKYEPLQKAP